jgi:hypothetical protein
MRRERTRSIGILSKGCKCVKTQWALELGHTTEIRIIVGYLGGWQLEEEYVGVKVWRNYALEAIINQVIIVILVHDNIYTPW